ncbi:response regulator transcription factor [Streptomyces europaeiscabiei]|uniref:Response regulator transcription factor n=1 Tax=Streptomyces europaeiscabiei TaxID=146819 RepID=A0AAJ2PRK0_9ACTN|nr:MULTISPECIES: response regulator transcription factor [Streptomyces]KFG02725.1 transcriptional regulator [Streptomyces scabiei]MDX3131912.1 response regulator transcription factor [Streptomyces europaeiscabiei]
MARKILLVDDDGAVREGIGRLLRFEGYETVLAENGLVALDALGAPGGEPDLVLMDVTMPGLDGLAATRRIRASGSTVPVMMITGRDAVGDRIVALDNGADDYLAKPFAPEELLARVRALLRRGQSLALREIAPRVPRAPADRLAYADVVMDLGSRAVTRAEHPLALTRTEYALLEYLLRHPVRVHTRARIFREVWGFEFQPASNTLDVYVMYLRRKLEGRGEPRILHTVRGLGYTLRGA